jgi:L-serine dehydratase
MPMEHRETALGGLAATPTGRKLTEQLRMMKDKASAPASLE